MSSILSVSVPAFPVARRTPWYRLSLARRLGVRYFLYPAYLVSEIKFYVDVDFQREWTCIFCLIKNKSGALVVTSSEDALYLMKIAEKGAGKRALLCTLPPRVHTLPLPTRGGEGAAPPLFLPRVNAFPRHPHNETRPISLPVWRLLKASNNPKRRCLSALRCSQGGVQLSPSPAGPRPLPIHPVISASPALRYAPMRTSSSNMDMPGTTVAQ